VGPQQWRPILLVALRDYKDIRVSKVTPKAGAWPPPDKELLLEQSSVAMAGAKTGDALLVETPDGKQRRIPVAGVVHDLSQISSFFRGTAYGYISMDTLEWVGETRDFNQLDFVAAENESNKAHVDKVAGEIRNKIENSGRAVFFTLIFDPPGRHWADGSLQAMTLILGVLGALSLLLSGFLVVNTITALLTQQVRQVGIMKAIGARGDRRHVHGRRDRLRILALFLAVPLGVIGAQAFAGFTARLLNSTSAPTPSPRVLMVSGDRPSCRCWRALPGGDGVRITVRQAIDHTVWRRRPKIGTDAAHRRLVL
jgi:putative ABC transport system permease protein